MISRRAMPAGFIIHGCALPVSPTASWAHPACRPCLACRSHAPRACHASRSHLLPPGFMIHGGFKLIGTMSKVSGGQRQAFTGPFTEPEKCLSVADTPAYAWRRCPADGWPPECFLLEKPHRKVLRLNLRDRNEAITRRRVHKPDLQKKVVARNSLCSKILCIILCANSAEDY